MGRLIGAYKTLVSLSRPTEAPLPSNIHFNNGWRLPVPLPSLPSTATTPSSDPPTQSTKPILPLPLISPRRRRHRYPSTPITPLALAPSTAVTPLTSSFIRGPVSISAAASTPSADDFRLQFSRPPPPPGSPRVPRMPVRPVGVPFPVNGTLLSQRRRRREIEKVDRGESLISNPVLHTIGAD